MGSGGREGGGGIWEDTSVSNVRIGLASNEDLPKKPDIVMHTCNPSAGKVDANRFHGLAGQLSQLNKFQASKRTCSHRQTDKERTVL